MSLNCTCGLLGNRTLTLCPNGSQLQLLNQSVIDHYGRKTRLMEHASNHHHDRIWFRGSLLALAVTNRVQKFLPSLLFFLSFTNCCECMRPLIDIPGKDLETSLIVRGPGASEEPWLFSAHTVRNAARTAEETTDRPNVNRADVSVWTLGCTWRGEKKTLLSGLLWFPSCFVNWLDTRLCAAVDAATSRRVGGRGGDMDFLNSASLITVEAHGCPH